jgi:hypothetical protein
MLAVILVVIAATAVASYTYLRLERLGPLTWVPLVSRAVAWSALGLLLLNVSCPSASRPQRPC